MNATIAVVCLRAENVAAAAHFYRDVIGLPMRLHSDHQPHFQMGTGLLVILQGKPQPPLDPVPERFPVLALAVDDLDQAVARLQAHEIKLPWGVEGGSTGRWTMFYDPGGNLVELVEDRVMRSST